MLKLILRRLFAQVREITGFVLHPESLIFLESLLLRLVHILINFIWREYLLADRANILFDKSMVGARSLLRHRRIILLTLDHLPVPQNVSGQRARVVLQLRVFRRL